MKETGGEEFPEIQSSRYSVLEVLGAGAVGTVYKAEDKVLGKIVAIKKLHRSATQTEAVRFQREAKLAGSLAHPNILNVADFGLTDKHEPYLVLGYVQGQTLAERMQQSNDIDFTEALDLFIQIARGLNHAHRHNVIHRDIKPTNIMLVDQPATPAARVQIVDFGLAKSELDQQELTKAGVGLGTPLYMAPEQSEGADVDARSDIYSFGCLMYEVVTGSPPFTADSIFELMAMKLDGDEVVLAEYAKYRIPPKFETMVNRCLRPNSAERYQSIEELLNELEQLQVEHLSSIYAPPENADAPNTVKKIDWQPVLFSVLVLSVTVGAAVLFLEFTKQPEVAKEETKTTKFISKKHGFDATGVIDDDLRQFLFGQEGKTITEIRFIDSCVTPKGYEQLIHHDIQAVTVKGGTVDRGILKSLAKVRSIRTIRLDENDSIDPAAFVELANMPLLTEFDLLGQENISALHIVAMSELPLMERAVVHSTHCNISGRFKSWKRLRNLRTVMLDYTDIDDNDIADLADFPIKRLTMDMTAISGRVINTLVRMKNLNEVSFVKAENINAVDYNRLRKLRPDITIHWKYQTETKPLPIPFGRL